MVRARHIQSLTLTSDTESPSPLSPGSEANIQRQRDSWKVALIGATSHPRPLWPTTEINEDENDRSVEYMPADWNPERAYKFEYENNNDDHGEGSSREVQIDYGQTAPSSSKEWEDISYSTGEEGDISWGEDEDVGVNTNLGSDIGAWGSWRDNLSSQSQWGEVKPRWGEEEDKQLGKKRGRSASVPLSSRSSTTGWDGDESEDTTS